MQLWRRKENTNSISNRSHCCQCQVLIIIPKILAGCLQYTSSLGCPLHLVDPSPPPSVTSTLWEDNWRDSSQARPWWMAPPGVPPCGEPVPHRVFNILQLCQKLPVDCSYVTYVQLISTLQYQFISALYTLYWHHQHIYLFILCIQYILLYMVVCLFFFTFLYVLFTCFSIVV